MSAPKAKIADYEGFVGKFKQVKTTDDCETPPAVYEAARRWVDENIIPLDGVEIVRPFWPGADYETADYPPGCLVLDNPPFSKHAKIRRFYHSRGIRYFLFAPTLTLFASALPGETFIVCGARLTYGNGAVVNTSFVTNATPATRLRVAGTLTARLLEADTRAPRQRPAYELPPHVCTPARLAGIAAAGIDLEIAPESCRRVTSIDSLRAAGKSLYGCGFLLSDEATRRKTAAERSAARPVTRWELSEAELAIVRSLR